MNGSILAGSTVRFKLSPEGAVALSGVFENPSFEAGVAGADDLGIWIDLGDQSAMLLKWQYLATAVISILSVPATSAVSKKIGF